MRSAPEISSGIAGTTIYDPSTGTASGVGRTAFPGNIIPASQISPITLQMQALVPEPNLPGTTSNYYDSKPVSFNRDNFDEKLNWTVSDKSSLWVKYSAMKALVTDQFSLGPAGGVGMINGGGAGTGNVLMQVVTLGGVHTFRPNLLVDGTFSISRDPLTLLPPDSGTAFGLNTLHIPGTNGPSPLYNGIPGFNVSGYEPLGTNETYLPKYIRNTYFTYSLNFGWTKGRHEFRFGGDLARFRVNEWHPETGGGPIGQIPPSPNGAVTLPGTGSPTQFNNYAAFLLGLPQSISKTISPGWMSPRQWMDALYFRDRWQVSHNLTMTLGMRWEYYPVMTYAQYGMVRFDPTSSNVYIGGQGNIPSDNGNSTSKKGFAPRFGLAYRLGDKTVLRGGYGISIDPQGPMAQMLFSTNPKMWCCKASPATRRLSPYGPIANGIPSIPVPNITSGVVPLPLAISTTSMQPGPYIRGYVQSYNFFVQRELPGGFFGVRRAMSGNAHRFTRTCCTKSMPADRVQGNNGRPLAITSGRVVDETFIEPVGGGNYNALQTRIDRKLTAGVYLMASYTHSKALDNVDNELGSLLFYDAANFARNRALAGFDRPNTFRLSWLGELPFGPRKHWLQTGLASKVLGGWQINGIFSAYNGTPFTVSTSSSSLNAPDESQTADQINPVVAKLGGIGSSSPYYDPTAFAAVTAVRYGTTGRNILRGPGVVNADGALFRNFDVKERWHFQLRGEAYNLSDTPHFNNPSASVSSGGFMTITSALSRASNVGRRRKRQFRVALRDPVLKRAAPSAAPRADRREARPLRPKRCGRIQFC